MKKLFSFLVILALTVSVSLAQNTATANQNGDFNNATITQTGSNEAYVEQNSSANALNKGNVVSVNQTLVGTLQNKSTVYQGDITKNKRAKRALATVQQTGEGNEALIYQVASKGVTEQLQTGNLNYAEATTSGGVKVYQTQQGNENYVRLGQGLMQNGQVDQYQEGDKNRAGITVAGPGTRSAHLRQKQIGNENESYIIGFRGNPGMLSYIDQFGNQNWADLQLTGGQKNGFVITQDGNLNTLDADITKNENYMDLYQLGNENDINIMIQNSGENTVTVSQTGNLNVANINQ
ncbi:MAG: hypothetical protein Kow0037_02460 [Calditrichia bacterium]